MKLTAQNTVYDEDSGAFLVKHTDEMQMLIEISESVKRIERRITALENLCANTNAEGGGYIG